MKSVNNKTLIFYHFQLQNGRDQNVTSLATPSTFISIRDVVISLPIDLSQGLYHFRFKSEMPDGNEKVTAWIDINNLGAKVPIINGSIFVKILKFKEAGHNKLFNLEKLHKADMVKNGVLPHAVHSAPKTKTQTPSPTPNKPPHKVDNNTSRANPQPQQPSRPQQPHPTRTPPASQSNQPQKTVPLPKQPAKKPIKKPSQPSATKDDNFIHFDSPKKAEGLSDEIKQNVITFQKQISDEQLNRKNERIASEELQDKIRKWGYTDMKKINNLTTLLATLHTIWPQWQPVSLSDMLKPEQVMSLFKKVVIKVHPDKNRDRHFKQKYLSKRIFELLNEARKQQK